jgi:2-desacetyl-2-hydroxyethyl bacteriochlorophyllide A dehydrogenase
MKMKGFMVTGPGEGAVGEAEKPVPGPGQCLIKVEYAGICGGDPDIFLHNNYGGTPENPRVSGHEYYGEVVEINNPGNRPCRIKIGDKVVGPQDAPCGVCDQCIAGRPSICSGMFGERRRPSGAFAEYLERDIDRVFPLAPGVDPVAATVCEPLAVASFDVRFTGVGLGDSVLIIGAGAVGILIGLLARHNGARDVIYAELSDYRLELLRDMGFKTCHSIRDDVSAAVREHTAGAGPDYVFETSGSQPGWDLSLEAAKYGGKVIPVGLPYVERTVNFGKVYDKELDLVTVNMHQTGDFSEAVHLVNRGELNADIRRIVTSIWPLEQTKEAMEASLDKNGRDIKILLMPGLDRKIDLIGK